MENEQRHPDIVICSCCNQHKVKTLLKRVKGRDVWVDARKRRWYGRKCPDCYLKYKKNYDAKRRIDQGYKPLGDLHNCNVCGKTYVMRRGSRRICGKCTAVALSKALGRDVS